MAMIRQELQVSVYPNQTFPLTQPQLIHQKFDCSIRACFKQTVQDSFLDGSQLFSLTARLVNQIASRKKQLDR